MFQLMVDGLFLETGQCALLLAEEEPRVEPEPALTLPLLTVELSVKGKKQSHKTATLMSVLLMVAGVNSGNGQNVLQLVEEEPRVGRDPALTLPLLMVEPIVKGKKLSHKIATLMSVLLMVDGVNSGSGQNVPQLVEGELRVEPGLALTLPLLTVEPIVKE